MKRPTITEFDPNSSPVEVWGLYDGYEFVTRIRRGSILQKLNNAGFASLWKLTPNGWVEVLRREKPAGNCEKCGYPGGTWCLNRRSGKITKELGQRSLCSTCDRIENY